MRQPLDVFVSIVVVRSYTLVVCYQGRLELDEVVVATFVASDVWLEATWPSGKNEVVPMFRQVWGTMVSLYDECIVLQHGRMHVGGLCLTILPDHGLVLGNLQAPVIFQKINVPPCTLS